MNEGSHGVFSVLSRRILGRLAAVLTGSLVLSGCEPGNPEAIALARVEESPVATLSVLGRVDYFPEAVLKNFSAETGIALEYQGYRTSDELEWMLQHSPEKFDVVLTDDVSIRTLLGLDLCSPIDRDLIPHWENLDPSSLGKTWDSDNDFSVPLFRGSTLIAYNRDLISNPHRSWSLLWDRETISEKPVYLVDEVCDLMGVASLAMGNTLDDARRASLSGAVAKLELLSRVGPSRFASYPTIRSALISDECAVAVLYSNEARRASRMNAKIDYFVPEEGAPQWIDSLTILRTSKKRNVAHGFVNFLLDAEVGAQCAWHNGGDTTNLASLELAQWDPRYSELLSFPNPKVPEEGTLFRIERPLSESLVTRLAGLMRTAHHSREP